MSEELEDVDVNIVDLLTHEGYEAAEANDAQNVDDVIDALEDVRAARVADKVADLYIPPGDKDTDLERLEGIESVISQAAERAEGEQYNVSHKRDYKPRSESDSLLVDDKFEDDANFNYGTIRQVPNEEFPDDDTSLPSEALVTFRGAPRENTVAAVGEVNGLRVFVGSDGKNHTETPRARRAFEDYFRMGRGRSLRKLAETYSDPSNPQWTNNFAGVHRKLQEYSANLDWQNRIRLMVMQESAAAIAAAQKSAAKHKRERINRAVKMQKIGEKILDKAMILDPDGEGLAELTVEEARQLIKPATALLQIGMQLERAEIGEAIERIKPPKDIGKMTDEELEEFIGVLQQELG